jgi:3-hydroxy-9,10-secoandrosta-1,3,5(10)-triene-9,17-dione monooxygenase reductase component
MTDDPIIDGADFRRVLGHFPTGVTVVTASAERGPVGMAIGSFASISLDPPLVGFFATTNSASALAIKEAGHYCVNILAADQMDLCGMMASKADDKFAGVMWSPAGGSGAPILPGAVAMIDCRLDSVIELGDHELLVGRVLHLDVLDTDDADPMIFYKGQYGGFGHL